MGRGRRPGPDRATVVVRGDGDRSLARGVVVDIRIVARLFRLPVLRLDGVVLLSPRVTLDEEPPVVARSTPTVVLDPPPPSEGTVIGQDLDRVQRTLSRLRNGDAAR